MKNAEHGKKEIKKSMTKREVREDCTTLGSLISECYADYKVWGGAAPLDTDLSHGVLIETNDNSRYGYGVSVSIYPYIKWSDGSYKPCHYCGLEYYLLLEKE